MVVAAKTDKMSFGKGLRRGFGEAAAGEQRVFAVIETAWGVSGVVWREAGEMGLDGFARRSPWARLSRICAPGQTVAELREYCERMHSGCREVLASCAGRFHPETVPEWFEELSGYLRGYYETGLREWSGPRLEGNWAVWRGRMDWTGVTEFQRRVREVVGEIPRGVALSYGQVAARIGKPAAARAVGAAIGSNPWPVLVPCHRVIGSTGNLGGFSAPGGVGAKRRMLEMEHG